MTWVFTLVKDDWSSNGNDIMYQESKQMLSCPNKHYVRVRKMSVKHDLYKHKQQSCHLVRT